MSQILRKDSFGVNIDCTVKENGVAVNLTTATQKNYIITKPSGIRMVKACSFITNGSDGGLRYTTVLGDTDELGSYRIQVDLIFPGGYDGPTDIGSYWVEDVL